jgi:hypothetical protein
MAEMRAYKRAAQVTGVLVAMCACGAAIALSLGHSAWAGLGVGAAIGCVLLGLATLAAIHKWWPHVEFPGELKTVGELAGMAVGLCPERRRPDSPWTPETVRDAVRAIAAETLNVKLGQLGDSTRFRDLLK